MTAMRYTEACHDALRTAADGRLEWRAGHSGTGIYWAKLPGMEEHDRTTSLRLDSAAAALAATGHLQHVSPARMRFIKVEITDLGAAALHDFDEQVAARNTDARGDAP